MKSKITIKKIQDLLIKGVQTIYVDDDTSRRMWWASLEVIQKEFLSQNYQQGGIWVASPLPALNDKKFFNKLHGWLWSPEGFPYFQKENYFFCSRYIVPFISGKIVTNFVGIWLKRISKR